LPLIAILIALLLPAVQRVRQAAVDAKLANQGIYGAGQEMAQNNRAQAALAEAAGRPVAPPPLARVQTFTAEVVLTPRLSVGTASPESIYEARFTGKIQAVRPPKVAGECELELPLPPQHISVADQSVTVGGQLSEQVALRNGKLVWRGTLPDEPTVLDVKYTAVGKGFVRAVGPARRDPEHVRGVAGRQRVGRAAAGAVPAADEPDPLGRHDHVPVGLQGGCCSASRCGWTCWGSRPSISSGSSPGWARSA